VKTKDLDIGRLVITVGWSDKGLFYSDGARHIFGISTVGSETRSLRVIFLKFIMWVGIA